MSTHTSWFDDFRKQNAYSHLEKHPIAYFCSEYAISEYLQIYAGGLGVLAADVLREAQDQRIPVVAVGLYYRQGYYHHDIESGQVVDRRRSHISAQEAGLACVMDAEGNELRIPLSIEDRVIYVRVWRVDLGSAQLLLLDTELDENNETDRCIAQFLYTSDRKTRCLQEVVLGVGGIRVLEALSIVPSVYHMNEGHAAFLTIALIQLIMDTSKVSFEQAKNSARGQLVFTNHTLVEGGNESFQIDLVRESLSALAVEMGIDIEQIIELGKVPHEDMFSMTLLAFSMCRCASAVSHLHSIKAKQIWPTSPMTPITNGIHLRMWDNITNENIEQSHIINKQKLLCIIANKTGQKWSEDVLLIGWARRVVSYKRPLALFHNLDRFKRLAQRANMPIRVVMAGKAHESDMEGAGYLRQLSELIEHELRGIVVYMSNYNMSLAKQLVCGCDVWLNTPQVGYEACGTSGMKAALNGALTMSTKDGWLDEVDIDEFGWELSDAYVSESCLDVLEQNVCPAYFSKDSTAWSARMHRARRLVRENYSATRMLRDYIEQLYLPTS